MNLSSCNEIKPFLNRHEIVDVTSYSKKDWKIFVTDTIHCENRDYLINSSKKYKKIDHLTLACETYEMKTYLSDLTLAQARLKFRQRSACVSSCKVMYPSQKDNLRTLFVCPEKGCTFLDNIWHWQKCETYAPLRISRNLNKEFQLLSYLQDIIDMRRKES